MLGAFGQPLALLNQGPTPLQEVVEPLGLLAGGLSPGEDLSGGLGAGIGLFYTAARGLQHLGPDAAKSFQVRGDAGHRGLQCLGGRRIRTGCAFLAFPAG